MNRTIYLALGCFWGAEKLFWTQPGVISTAVGYMGGHADAPTYRQVCTGTTGHAETVRVDFDDAATSLETLLKVFFENHDPTQGNRQGNDIGTQYRSVIFVTDADQRAVAEGVLNQYADAFAKAGYPPITTEILDAPTFWPAEEYHQRYLEKNPGGYCPVHATGVTCG